MSTEDRLREALRAHADRVHPTGSYEAVRNRAAAARRVRRLRTTALTGLAAAAAISVVVAAVAVIGDDGQRVDVGPAQPGPATTEADGTTTTTSPSDPGDVGPFVYVTDSVQPEAAAEDFAVEYLGMRDPIVGEFQQGGPNDGEVPVQATDPGAVTVVGLRRAGEGVWGVTFAASDNIRVASPGPLELVSSPLRVTGEARAFEGTVQVEVRRDDERFRDPGTVIGSGFVTGNGGFEHGPFEGEISFDHPGVGAGAVVFYTTSAEDGSLWEATVVRVIFD